MTKLLRKNYQKVAIIMALSMSLIISYRTFSSRLIRKSNSLSNSLYNNHKAVQTSLFSTSISEPIPTFVIPSIQHPAYEEVEKTYIEEYSLTAILFKHKKTGAQIMSVSAADENKVFGVTLRTPPKDSTGIPHILEHSVLCGSKKFPVKEPFVDLLKGSLQNFLNAFTYPDRTCYPVASTNTKDFYNLIHVYLDAVYFPRAINDPQVLQQEGWHFECEDPSQPLTYKGVVYNEMKGVYSSPDSLLGRSTQQALFPENTYGVDSGGDPLVIPTLTYDQFQQFHSNFYHPSNSRLFFYGNDDVLTRLNLVDEYLDQFTMNPVAVKESQVKFQPKKNLISPQQDHANGASRLVQTFPLSAGTEPKHMLTVNWLLNDQPLSAKERLALGVLDDLLLGTSSAALRKILTESQLGESVTGGGLSDELLQATFSVGLKGVKQDDIKKVEDLVLSSLNKIAADGFERSAIEASINTIEFRLREFNTGSFPKGLSIMLGMMSQWIYDGSPFEAVRFEAPLQELKQDLASNLPVFQDLLKKYIVSNNHRVSIEMKPVEGLELEQEQEEVQRLATIKESLSPADINQIIESTRVLKAAQLAEDSEEAKKSIPRLSLADIDPKCAELPLTVVDNDMGVTMLEHEVPSAGILYFDLALDYSGVSEEDLPYLPLLSRMLLESGTSMLDEVALSRKIGSLTGGIQASYYSDVRHKSGVVADSNDVLLYMVLSGKSTRERIPVLLELMSDVLLSANLKNKKRAVEMLKESKVRKQTAVLTSGHTYGAARLAARFSFLGHLGEVTGGLTSVRDAATLLELAESDWPAVERRLERIRAKIVRRRTDRSSVIVNLTGDRKTLDSAAAVVKSIVSKLPTVAAGASDASEKSLMENWRANSQSLLLPMKNEGFAVPSQVNYVCKGAQIYEPNEPVSAATSVVSRYLSTGYLWDNVRVVGGAYGGFARFSETSGRMMYLSYRDPNLVQTLNIYDKAADALAAAEITDEDILQAIIGTVGDLDAPLSPSQKGFASMTQFISGETPSDRQKARDEVLQTSEKDFKSFAARLTAVKDKGVTVVFGAKAALDQANSELTDENQKLNIEPAFLK